MILGVHGLPIGAATAPGHPGAVARLHDGIEGSGEAPSRLTPAEGISTLEQTGHLEGQTAEPAHIPARGLGGHGLVSARGARRQAVPTMAIRLTVRDQDEPGIVEKRRHDLGYTGRGPSRHGESSFDKGHTAHATQGFEASGLLCMDRLAMGVSGAYSHTAPHKSSINISLTFPK